MSPQDWALVAMPLVGALIGWLTNLLAVRMLFRPREPVRILGTEWVGLVPRRRAELAVKIADVVEANLLSAADLTAALEDPEVQRDVTEQLERRVGDYMQKALTQLPSMVQAFIPQERLARLRASVVEEIARQLPDMATVLAERLEKKLDIRQLVIERVEGFDADRLERLVLEIARRELRHIELLGGVLGFFVGLAQAGVAYVFLR